MSILKPQGGTTPLTAECTESRFSSDSLAMLLDPTRSYLLPLAVIAHIDMNAFFAQCEQIRLGRSITDPVVCAQWNSLIAVSYAARKFGIGRMDTIKSAKEKCPNLVVGHAAVFKKGETHWQYLDGPPNQALHKVSLDPYRRELRKIMKILARECDLVEKASVDECYLDLGRLVYGKLMENFPALHDLESEILLRVPSELPVSLQWQGEIIQTEQENPEGDGEAVKVPNTEENITLFDITKQKKDPSIRDWDDVCMLVGSQILRKIRQDVYDELKYTTSGGLASTKTVAKLAGGYVKPDYQTIIRPRLMFRFFESFQLTDFTMMGGKAGEIITEKLAVPLDVNSISFIRENYTLAQIKTELPVDLPSEKIFELVRGIHHQEFKPRTAVKSMMSRKNFLGKHPVDTMADAYDWVRVFVGDLYGRLVELDDENMNLSMLQTAGGEKGFIYRPRTVSVQVTTESYSKHSKQTQFQVLKSLDKVRHSLETTGFRLLAELLDGTRAAGMNPNVKFKELRVDSQELANIRIPNLASMSLIISNFVKTSDANLIDSYGTSGGANTQETIKRLFDEAILPKPVPQPEPKKKPTDNSYVKKLFEDYHSENAKRAEPEAEPKRPGAFKEDKEYVERLFTEFERSEAKIPQANTQANTQSEVSASAESTPPPDDPLLRELIENRHCKHCNIPVEDVFEHKDYHVALMLSLKLNGPQVSSPKEMLHSPPKPLSSRKPPTSKKPLTSPTKVTTPRKDSKGPKKKAKLEKGQSRLPF